jgi:hypothetical protein
VLPICQLMLDGLLPLQLPARLSLLVHVVWASGPRCLMRSRLWRSVDRAWHSHDWSEMIFEGRGCWDSESTADMPHIFAIAWQEGIDIAQGMRKRRSFTAMGAAHSKARTSLCHWTHGHVHVLMMSSSLRDSQVLLAMMRIVNIRIRNNIGGNNQAPQQSTLISSNIVDHYWLRLLTADHKRKLYLSDTSKGTSPQHRILHQQQTSRCRSTENMDAKARACCHKKREQVIPSVAAV